MSSSYSPATQVVILLLPPGDGRGLLHRCAVVGRGWSSSSPTATSSTASSRASLRNSSHKSTPPIATTTTKSASEFSDWGRVLGRACVLGRRGSDEGFPTGLLHPKSTSPNPRRRHGVLARASGVRGSAATGRRRGPRRGEPLSPDAAVILGSQFKTDQAQDAKKMEKLNFFFALMTRGLDADISEVSGKEEAEHQQSKKGRGRRQKYLDSVLDFFPSNS